jgi:hypothetical protein
MKRIITSGGMPRKIHVKPALDHDSSGFSDNRMIASRIPRPMPTISASTVSNSVLPAPARIGALNR